MILVTGVNGHLGYSIIKFLQQTIGMVKISTEGFVNGALSYTSNDLEKLLGRVPTGTDEFLKEFVES